MEKLPIMEDDRVDGGIPLIEDREENIGVEYAENYQLI